MITKNSAKEAIRKAIEETVSQLESEMAFLDQARVNRVPYVDSWTAK